MQQARAVLTWLARLFLVALVVQFFFAGAGAFRATTDWDLHIVLGYVLVIASLVVLIVAVLARRSLVLASLLFGAMVLQMLLAQLDDTSRWLASLHAVNALAVIGLAGGLAGHARRRRVPAA
jgi:hypothetical protein